MVETVHRVSELGTDGSRHRPSGTSQEAETSMSQSYTQPVFITRRYRMQQPQRRSRLILGVLSLGLLVGAALTAHPAQAVEAVGPYYAEPAWAQKLPAATRFVVLTNWKSQAVLDKETGLVWERSPQGGGFRGRPPATSASTRTSAIGKAGGCRRSLN